MWRVSRQPLAIREGKGYEGWTDPRGDVKSPLQKAGKTPMFDALQEKFQRVFKTLRVQGVLNEQAVDETLREVRLALLEADVNFKVVKELLDRVRVRALGEEVRSSLTPDQEVVRIVRDELVQILGGDTAFLTFSKDYPTV